MRKWAKDRPRELPALKDKIEEVKEQMGMPSRKSRVRFEWNVLMKNATGSLKMSLSLLKKIASF